MLILAIFSSSRILIFSTIARRSSLYIRSLMYLPVLFTLRGFIDKFNKIPCTERLVYFFSAKRKVKVSVFYKSECESTLPVRGLWGVVYS